MKHKLISFNYRILLICMLVSLTGCSSNRMHFVNSRMDDSESEMMYVTANGTQEMADKVFEIIINSEDADELLEYKSQSSQNVTEKRCKEVLETLDGEIDNEELIYIDVDCSADDEKANYSFDAHYYLTVDGEEYVLSFCDIIVGEYEVFRHGIHSLVIEKYEDYNPDNHREDFVLPDEVKDRRVMVFNTPVTANHNNDFFSKGFLDNTQYDSRALMEEILYLVEEDDEKGLIDLYANVSVNGENMDEIPKKQVGELLSVMGGKKNLEAAGGIVDHYSFDLKPQDVDCEGIEKPEEYGMRYIIEIDGVKYKLQIVYVSSEDKTMPEDYVGIQSITFVE